MRKQESERDALRFHWRGPGNDETSVYRFTRALFSLTCSPFLLNGTLGEHLKSWETKYPSLVAERKAHLLLYGCSLTRAVHLEVLKSMETSEFIPSLKRFIARRGRPKVIYSDNAKTFKAAAKWLRKVQQDERFHAFLAENAVKWRFNLSRAPWWGWTVRAFNQFIQVSVP